MRNGGTTIWRPSASLQNLQRRSEIIVTIRNFFANLQVLEVETPLLGRSTATDPHISSFAIAAENHSENLYLQTSPEFPMKRLLAAGIGSVYQIARAFRAGEQGRLHNPEFTILEWYRVGFDHYRLMDEIDQLMYEVLHTMPADRFSYAEIFQEYLHLDPHSCTIPELQACVQNNHLVVNASNQVEDKDYWLNLLLTHCIEPHLGKDKPVFITDYPASQAALAKLKSADPRVAERFELYFRGIELANGYHELTDAKEQRQRFIADNKQRNGLGLAQIPLDESLLAALDNKMPSCAGVALGLDRLIMMACSAQSVAEVMAFSMDYV